jgi:histidyl-tRNA synthetase
MQYKAPRGTADILPQDQPYWRHIERIAIRYGRLYGYERIETPVFEDAGLFIRTVGQGTDIVEKETYTFSDRSDNQLTLRPEGTASVCRAYLEHGLRNLPQPVKLFYFTTVYRYERPQAGRYREHHQFGCEAIGDGDPALDAEVIDLAWQFFHALGLKRISLELNSIGCPKCRPDYLAALREYYSRAQTQLCADCVTRLERNTLRLLDCKKPGCQGLADAAPRSVDHLCPECAEHFRQLTRYLDLLVIPYHMNHRLVRGLDYYTRTVFEIQPAAEGAQSTLGGGGRYDNLLAELGGEPTPAIGFATGMERIVLNLHRENVAIPPLPHPEIMVAASGAAAREAAFRLAADLRQRGLGVILPCSGKSLKAQLREANSRAVKYTAILGEDEVKAGTVTLRDMAGAAQESLPQCDLGARLDHLLSDST